MTKNPILNAVGSSAYITVVVTIMNFVSQQQRNRPDTFFAPVAFLSLLTLSATVMAFIFFYQPIQLLFDKKKKEAFNLFAQTVAIFAAITGVIVLFVFSGLI